MLSVAHNELSFDTQGRGFIEITESVQQLVAQQRVLEGIATICCLHTSASLLISENADPEVLQDLETTFQKLAPDGDPRYRHTAEGPDDMSAHLRSVLTQQSLSVPICSQKLRLGTWQGIYLWEHRLMPHRRIITVTLMGTTSQEHKSA